MRDAMTGLLARSDLLVGTVKVPGLGVMRRREGVLEICTFDLLIHTWDLGQAVGIERPLPEDAVTACHRWLLQLPVEVLRAPGRYGPPVTVPDDADAQTRTLAFAGRNP
jgi:uncharacterized protein (TIGR03086 family)